jgi:hypothetical protein
MLINTLFSSFDLMLHVYTCLSDFSINCSIWIPLMARCTRCLCDKLCQWLAADRLFPPGTLYCFLRVLYTVSSGYSILFPPGTLYCFLRVLYTVSSVYSILFSPGTLYCFLRVLYTVSSGYSMLFPPGTLYCFLRVLYTVSSGYSYTVSSGYSILFPPGTLYYFLRVLYAVSSTNKMTCHDITDILLKVTLKTITLNLQTIKTSKYNICTWMELWVEH